MWIIVWYPDPLRHEHIRSDIKEATSRDRRNGCAELPVTLPVHSRFFLIVIAALDFVDGAAQEASPTLSKPAAPKGIWGDPTCSKTPSFPTIGR